MPRPVFRGTASDGGVSTSGREAITIMPGSSSDVAALPPSVAVVEDGSPTVDVGNAAMVGGAGSVATSRLHLGSRNASSPNGDATMETISGKSTTGPERGRSGNPKKMRLDNTGVGLVGASSSQMPGVANAEVGMGGTGIPSSSNLGTASAEIGVGGTENPLTPHGLSSVGADVEPLGAGLHAAERLLTDLNLKDHEAQTARKEAERARKTVEHVTEAANELMRLKTEAERESMKAAGEIRKSRVALDEERSQFAHRANLSDMQVRYFVDRCTGYERHIPCGPSWPILSLEAYLVVEA